MSIKIEGLSELIKYLKEYQKSLTERQQKCLKLLADIGIDTANVRFSQAQYDGSKDVTVKAEWVNEKTIAVVAEGETVCFIEFGAGVFYSEQHPLSNELGMHRGAFGSGKGNQSTWGYYGEKGTNGRYLKSTDKGDLILTHGNPPSRAMYEAGKTIQQQILDIVRQVFCFD